MKKSNRALDILHAENDMVDTLNGKGGVWVLHLGKV